MSDAWAEGGHAFTVLGIRWCGLYNFFVPKMRFCAGYRRVRVICVCMVYIRENTVVLVLILTVGEKLHGIINPLWPNVTVTAALQ